MDITERVNITRPLPQQIHVQVMSEMLVDLAQSLILMPDDHVRSILLDFCESSNMFVPPDFHLTSFVTGGGFISILSFPVISLYNMRAIWSCLMFRYNVGGITSHQHTRWYTDSSAFLHNLHNVSMPFFFSGFFPSFSGFRSINSTSCIAVILLYVLLYGDLAFCWLSSCQWFRRLTGFFADIHEWLFLSNFPPSLFESLLWHGCFPDILSSILWTIFQVFLSLLSRAVPLTLVNYAPLLPPQDVPSNPPFWSSMLLHPVPPLLLCAYNLPVLPALWNDPIIMSIFLVTMSRSLISFFPFQNTYRWYHQCHCKRIFCNLLFPLRSDLLFTNSVLVQWSFYPH